jgi:SAM-dependent methyltransferase
MSALGIARRLGPLGRRWGWNRVFREGAWFAGPRRPEFSTWAQELSEGRHVRELACGDGSLAAEIALTARSYVGFDVSAEAVRIANRRRDVPVHAIFLVGEMQEFTPDSGVDLIIIEEALYYLSARDRERLLRRCLAAGARVLVTVHDGDKHEPTLLSCYAAGRVVECRVWNARVAVLLEAKP